MVKLMTGIGFALALWFAYALGDLHGQNRRSLEAINDTWTWYKTAAHFAERDADEVDCRRAPRVLATMLLERMRSSVELIDLRPNPLMYAAMLPWLLYWQPSLRVPNDYRSGPRLQRPSGEESIPSSRES